MKSFTIIPGVISLICPIILSACQDDSTLEALTEKGVDKTVLYDAASRSIDDEDILYKLQTDQIGMLINGIQRVGDQYVLTITQEDAHELGIPDSTYSIVQSIVINYNSSL